MKKDFKIEESIEKLIVDFLNGRLSLNEIDKLNEWLGLSVENRKIFQDYQKIWIGSSTMLPDGIFPSHKAWKNVSKEFKKPSYRQIYMARQQVRRTFRRYVWYAAMLVSIFALGVITSYLIYSSNSEYSADGICEISVPQGSRSRVVLPDNSIVWLNAGSTIYYSNDFNKSERIVRLEGEAHFNVRTNILKPFIVRTEHLNVKALGTIFNVKAYPDELAVTTTLVEGKVLIEIPGQEKSFTYNLEPKQNFTYKISPVLPEIDESILQEDEEIIEELTEAFIPEKYKPLLSVRSNIRPELFTSWKDEVWIIEGETLTDMAVMLGRRYNTLISLQSEELQRYRFTGKIMNETLEQVLEILRMTTPLKYTVGKGSVDWEIDPEAKKEFDLILE